MWKVKSDCFLSTSNHTPTPGSLIYLYYLSLGFIHKQEYLDFQNCLLEMPLRSINGATTVFIRFYNNVFVLNELLDPFPLKKALEEKHHHDHCLPIRTGN